MASGAVASGLDLDLGLSIQCLTVTGEPNINKRVRSRVRAAEPSLSSKERVMEEWDLVMESGFRIQRGWRVMTRLWKTGLAAKESRTASSENTGEPAMSLVGTLEINTLDQGVIREMGTEWRMWRVERMTGMATSGVPCGKASRACSALIGSAALPELDHVPQRANRSYLSVLFN